MNSIAKKAFDKKTLLACKGYNPKFINGRKTISAEKILSKKMQLHLPTVEGNNDGVLNYSDLSVYYNKDRKIPFFAAYNIDGGLKINHVNRANNFRADPRIDSSIQLNEKVFYALRTDITEFEIGHMAANNEMAWGNKDEAQFRAYQTFFYTNSVPQAERLNSGIWKVLESYIIDEAAITSNKKICVITGPVINDNDPFYKWDKSFRIPLLFFKVILFATAKDIYATAFMMSHEQKMIEDGMIAISKSKAGMKAMKAKMPFEDFKYRKVFQVNLPLLEEYTGLSFKWNGVKNIKVPNDKNQIQKIRKIKDAKDAHAANKALKRGIAPKKLNPTTTLSTKEIKSKNFKLNIVLP